MPTLTGAFVISYLDRSKCFLLSETIALGFGAGIGLLTFIIFLMGVARIPFNLPLLVLIQLMILFFCLCMLLIRSRASTSTVLPSPDRFRNAQTDKAPKWMIAVSAILLLLIFLKISFVFFESFTRPIFSWDARENWSSGAKMFFYSKGLLLDNSEFFFGKGYRTYLGHPLNHSLLQVWFSLWVGEFHEVYSKIGSSLYYSMTLVLFYVNARKDLGWFWAIVALFSLSSLPLLTYHGTDAYADMTLSFYSFAAVLCFWNYMKERKNEYLVIAGILLSFGFFTKNEGLFYFVAVNAALLIFLFSRGGETLKSMKNLIVPFVIIAAPWMIFKLVFGIGYGHGDESSSFKLFVDPANPTAAPKIHFEVLGVFLKELFFNSNFNLVFACWLSLAVLGFRYMKNQLIFLNIVILLVMLMFFLTYIVSEAAAVTEATGIHRNSLTYMPIMLYSTALLVRRLYKSKKDNIAY